MARNPLSCGAQCSRITLITLNIIFLICGIALLVLGLVFRFGGNEIKMEIKTTFENVKFDDYDLYGILNSLAIIFIVVGAIIIIFSILGFIGAVCYVRAALVVYAILLGVCLAIELAGVVLFFIMRGELEKAAKVGLKDAVDKSNNNQSDFQKATEYLFETYECCHVEQKRLKTMKSDMCSTSAKAYGEDCYDSIENWLKSYQVAFIVIGICVMIIELLLIICACWVCRVASRKEELV